MDNFELENVNTEVANTENGVDKGLIALAAAAGVGGLGTIYFYVKYKKKIKEMQEKDANFQMILREHQAEIDALTSERERQMYLIRIYKEYISKMEK